MWGIVRRRIASGGSSTSILGQSLQRIRPAVSAQRSYTTAGKEAFLLGSVSKHARNFSHHILLGGQASSRPLRETIAFIQVDSPIQLWSRSFSSDSGDLAEVVVPFMGESITDGTLAKFLKQPGDTVGVDEPIAQVETDKVTIDVASPEAGVIQKFVAKEGDTVEPGTKIAVISKSGEGVTHAAPSETQKSVKDAPQPSPPAEKENVDKKKPNAETAAVKEKPKSPSVPPPKASATEPQLPPKERERRVPMTRLRKRVATRLKDSQNTFAMLTTFNEVDMTNLMKLRSEYKDAFVEKHGVKLGLMSGFVKAAVSGLQNQPIINAVIDGDDIIYRDYIDISIAVGTPKGLVVPVIRNAEKMNFADIEKSINTLAKKATDGTISIDEMAGGSFTISNGGVYGSLLSTPIINPPQSAILGMHSEVVPGPVLQNGIRIPPPGICDMLRFHLEGPEYKMTLPVEPRFTVPLCQTVSVSVLVGRKDSNKVACIINKSIFDYIDRTAYRALAFDYLDFSPVYPFVSGIRAWISLLFMDDRNEGVIDVFGIEMDFCDAANSEEEVLWLLDMLDWK